MRLLPRSSRSSLPLSVVAAVNARDGRVCRYCGRVCIVPRRRPGESAAAHHARELPSRLLMPTLDHVVPASRGGADTPDNVVVACRRCNTRKGARTPDEAQMPLRRPGDLALQLLSDGAEVWLAP